MQRCLTILLLAAAAMAEEQVDPWLQEAIAPWRKVLSIQTSQHDRRDSFIPNPKVDINVTRSLNWTWQASPLAFLVAIEAGPRVAPSDYMKKNPEAWQRYQAFEYPPAWCTRALLRQADRYSAFDPQTGVIRTGSIPSNQREIASLASDPVPLWPLRCLAINAEGLTSESLLLERLRDEAWIAGQWKLLSCRTQEASATRHVIAGSLPINPADGNAVAGKSPRGDAFTLVLERDAATGVPVVTGMTDAGTPVKATFTYAAHRLADGSPIPICSRIELRSAKDWVKPWVMELTSCTIDAVIDPGRLAIDPSQAREVFDVDTGVSIPVDAGR